MQSFQRRLEALSGDAPHGARRWVYVAYDQLTDQIGPLACAPPGELGVVLVEAPAKASRRPYHKQKLAWVLANQRHFALEQAERGVAVRYEVAAEGYAETLRQVAAELGPLTMMEPAERELRVELTPLVREGRLRTAPHAGWLTTREDFEAGAGEAPWRLDAFYKHVRRRTGILMEGTRPVGGKLSFDVDNRQPWHGEPEAPEPPCFEPDEITREVGELIARRFAHHPGLLRLERIAATRADAERAWSWARAACLPCFGPFEDAMSTRSATLFHTLISPLLNLHRLLPRRVVHEVAEDESLPLSSREGFVRQILGWREFVRHVHVATDGFRQLPDGEAPAAAHPGDGGYGRWRGTEWPTGDGHGGAKPSVLGAHAPLPRAYWGTPSGLACLDHVVESVWRDGYSHHITRLMVLANLATLLGVEPRELTDWFWVAYVDAYDWVVEPNVLAMGSYGVGGLMTTKPYVSGAPYIHKMSDYCAHCPFDPKRDCPVTRLYWAFLARHAERLRHNPRTARPVASLARRSAAARQEDARVYARVSELLGAGELITREALVR